MRGKRFHLSGKTERSLAWSGLLLMVLSLLWLVSVPGPRRPIGRSVPGNEPSPVVVLDAGHGGQDSGAMAGTVLEKDLTLDVAQRVDRRLRAQGVGTVMTRMGDNYISLADRVALANEIPDCLLVSIHFNEGKKKDSSGIETYYAEHQLSPGQTLASWLPFLQHVSVETPNLESQSLAGFIQQALVDRTHAVDRGVKAHQFFVLTNVCHPAVLVEGGFMTNKEDVARLGDIDYREEIAAAVSQGILRYRQLLREGRKKPVPSSKSISE